MNKETIEEIGRWTIKVILCAGTIYLYIIGKDQAAGGLATLAVLSFFFL